jgi:phage tail-like protein
MNDSRLNFIHLNAEGRWAGFAWSGLELRPDGTLRLASLPVLQGEVPESLDQLAAPAAPAGIALDADGNVYFSVPGQDAVLKLEQCDSTVGALPCAHFGTPRGLLVPRGRAVIFVADSARHRILILDLASRQLVGLWGEAQPAAPRKAPGLFDTPTALAGDAENNVYVVDAGNRRVQKFDASGEVVPAFAEALAASQKVTRPREIAVLSTAERTRVFVLDRASNAIAVFDAAGQLVGEPISLQKYIPDRAMAMGLAVGDAGLFVGDNGQRRILQFTQDETGAYGFVGQAIGYHGPIAALAMDRAGNLLVHTGEAQPPLRLAPGAGYGSAGALWNSQPIAASERAVHWHRLRATVQQPGGGGRVHVRVQTTDDPKSGNPFKTDPAHWPPPPDDVPGLDDLLIGSAPGKYLWVGVLLTGDGLSTPVLSQLRADFDQPSWLEHLPPIYSAGPEEQGAPFLERLLALVESMYGDVEDRIGRMAELFDPAATPAAALPWLAGWLAVDWDEEWSVPVQRDAIAQALARHARSGTAGGLRESLRLLAGVDAVIEEPVLSAEWWALPAVGSPCAAEANSVLGFTTMLATGPAEGAVVGRTASLDRSRLITGEEFGAPLFDELTDQVRISVHRGQLPSEAKLSLVRAVIEREKPAHVICQLSVIEPQFRVGFQARIGVDTVVAGQTDPSGLGPGFILGVASVLSGEPPKRMGRSARLGSVALAD